MLKAQQDPMAAVLRYHPVLVVLHWLLALLLIGTLLAGFFLVGVMPNTNPHKIGVLKLHMAGGMLILALMLLRFVVRLVTAKPPPAQTGSATLDRLVPLGHLAMYGLVVLMVATGYATGILAGLPDIVFAGSGQPLPPDFHVFWTRVAHGWLAILLAIAIVLHIGAALYHHFGRRDGLLRRMTFGPR